MAWARLALRGAGAGVALLPRARPPGPAERAKRVVGGMILPGKRGVRPRAPPAIALIQGASALTKPGRRPVIPATTHDELFSVRSRGVVR
jgi:hypothetical protein